MSELCAVKQHVLRYWEQEFPTLKPIKRRGNRRYYQRQDVILIRQIRSLLWEHEYTIAGARQKLASGETKRDSEQSRQIVRQVRIELEEILAILRHTRRNASAVIPADPRPSPYLSGRGRSESRNTGRSAAW